MDYISARDAASEWGITQRRVEALCLNGQVQGAERISNMWLIPKSTTKPIDGRTKAGKKQGNTIEYGFTLDSERIIGMVDGTMAIENMPLSDEDRKRLYTVLNGEITADEMVQQLVTKYRRSAGVDIVRV